LVIFNTHANSNRLVIVSFTMYYIDKERKSKATFIFIFSDVSFLSIDKNGLREKTVLLFKGYRS